MAYSATSDVANNLAKLSFTSTSKPNTTQIAELIADVDGEIDSALAARGITVPVTAPSHFVAALKSISGAGATARVAKSMFPDTVGAGETPAYAYWQRIYDNGIAGLKDGSLVPNDVVGTTTGYVAPSTYFTRNPDDEENLGDISEPFFKRSTVF